MSLCACAHLIGVLDATTASDDERMLALIVRA
eukprot:CAMPEP_0180647988 /NCGR_PEP_ID=MMETSP1037_2-20121125/50668_1 /TAXON_ID=632150 /ORGANISM="Azadinium spinosum, Strain 3D9" /LENGTH=31 /DNA_ID= /DNA_START= /DNA_END= /DNA_ORIENTATION=